MRNASVEISMHRNPLMMSVDLFEHLLIRARKPRNLRALAHSNGFPSRSGNKVRSDRK